MPPSLIELAENDDPSPTQPPIESSSIKSPEFVLDYDRFLQRLRHPSCRPLLSEIRRYCLFIFNCRSFIALFKALPTRPAQQCAAYDHFMQRIRPLVANHPVFLQGGRPEQLNALEGIETLICNQIYEQ